MTNPFVGLLSPREVRELLALPCLPNSAVMAPKVIVPIETARAPRASMRKAPRTTAEARRLEGVAHDTRPAPAGWDSLTNVR